MSDEEFPVAKVSRIFEELEPIPRRLPRLTPTRFVVEGGYGVDEEGNMIAATQEVDIHEPPVPVQVQYDTPIENHIQDDLHQITTDIKNVGNAWKAVRTVDEACKVAATRSKLLESRRKLGNKQLGATEAESLRRDIFHHD